MIDINISVVDKDHLQKALVNIETKSKNLVPALKLIGIHMLSSVDKNFETQGRPKKWAQLAPSTVAQRRNKNKSSIKILQDTGALRGSMIFDVDNNSVKIGTNKEYAPYHQFGAKIPAMTIIPRRKKALRFVTSDGKVIFAKKVKQRAKVLPARPFLMFQDSDKIVMRDILKEHLLGII